MKCLYVPSHVWSLQDVPELRQKSAQAYNGDDSMTFGCLAALLPCLKMTEVLSGAARPLMHIAECHPHGEKERCWKGGFLSEGFTTGCTLKL